MAAAMSHALAESPLWRNRSFVLLFASQVISLLGSGVTTVGLALLAYDLRGDATAAVVVGHALTLRIVAFLVFSQPAGVLADRLNRKGILIAADVARFLLVGLFPFISEIWQIHALVFAINALTAFFTPVYEASIPDVVGPQNYVKALSLSRVATDIENILAPALTAALVAAVGVRWVFWVDAGTYLVSAVLVASASLRQLISSAKTFALPDFLRELTQGTRILLRRVAIRRALLLSFAEATAGAVAIVGSVVYVKDVLHAGDRIVSVVMAMIGCGSSAAAFVLTRWARRVESDAQGDALHAKRHHWTRYALIAGGAFLTVCLAPGLLVPAATAFAILWFVNGAGQALVALASSTVLAEHTTPQERGRAYAAHFSLTHLCWLITYPAVGSAIASIGAPTTMTAASVVCLMITLLAARTPREASR